MLVSNLSTVSSEMRTKGETMRNFAFSKQQKKMLALFYSFVTIPSLQNFAKKRKFAKVKSTKKKGKSIDSMNVFFRT